MTKWLQTLFSRRGLKLLLVYGLIFVGSGFLGNLWMTRDQISGVLPQITSVDLSGTVVRLGYGSAPGEAIVLADANLEKPLLVYFFAEWCPICKLQNGAISDLQPDYSVLGIAMQSGNDASVKQYMADQDIGFRVINDETGQISRLFHVNGVPAAFIVNQNGLIQYSTRGYASELGLRSRLWLSDQS
ncbi:MAG: protein disulfide oxidoreductase [Gammaproteobacteria bacterium]|nr:protein disulfide oxidoreductase [Gammaproteobacteria bacterium]MBL7000884.1 protein disulfide oxidoreductase [Gammaproteobacteria bacterium]